MSDHVQFHVVPSHGDARGFSHSVPASTLSYLRELHDVHLAELIPGGIRGNHYHVERRELLLIRHEDRWRLHHDKGESTQVRRDDFNGAGLVCVEVPPLCSHAVENTGGRSLVIIAISDFPYTPANPDTVGRTITGVG